MTDLCKDEIIKAGILKVAQQLFQQYGLSKTTMEDIAKEMCKGKSTLYYYFKSKEEIFYAVVQHEIDEVFEKTKLAVEQAVTAEEKIKAFHFTKILAVRRRANLYKTITVEIRENGQYFQCVQSLKRKYISQEISLIKDVITYGIEQGEFTRLDENDLDILSYVMVVSIRGLEQDLFIEDKFPNLETRLDFITSIMCKGLKK